MSNMNTDVCKLYEQQQKTTQLQSQFLSNYKMATCELFQVGITGSFSILLNSPTWSRMLHSCHMGKKCHMGKPLSDTILEFLMGKFGSLLRGPVFPNKPNRNKNIASKQECTN